MKHSAERDELMGECDNEFMSTRAEVKKILWTKKEDEQLKTYVNDMPTQCRISWTALSSSMGDKTAKQCRDRWCKSLKTI